MRALVVSDIHGNAHALQAVLAAGEPFDQLWNLGDAVGYGAEPNQVIDLLRARATLNVRGNHDRVCAGLTSSEGFNPVAAEAAAWTARTLTPGNRDWLRDVAKGPIASSSGVACAHGSPLHEDQYIFSMRDAWLPLQRMAQPLTFFGHTHVQGAFLQNGADWEEVLPGPANADGYTLHIPPDTRLLVNPGSVGQPRNNDPRACFALYDTEAGVITFRRVLYDVPAAQAAIRAAGLPERLATRLEVGH